VNDEVLSDEARGETALPADAIVKTVHVPLAPDQAFELFTARMREWWPLATHSSGGPDAVSVAVDGHVGGLIVETLRDGSTCIWGTVTRWVPPHELAFTWHPGNEPDAATDVSVTFGRDAEGCTVTLLRTGWAKRRDADDDLHARYDTGWEYVLGRFAAAA